MTNDELVRKLQSKETVWELFRDAMRENKDSIALRWKNGDGNWLSFSYGALEEITTEYAMGLIDLGVKNDGEFGDRVVVLTNNRPEFLLSEIALKQIGAIMSPAHKEYTPEEVKYNLLDAGAKKIVVAGDDNLAKVLEIPRDDIPDLEHIIVGDLRRLSVSTARLAARDSRIVDMDELLTSKKSQATRDELDARRSSLRKDDVVTLIYTSGTTGHPKGVMLSNDYILSGAQMVMEAVDMPDPYVALNIIPLAHSFGYVADLIVPMTIGGSVIYSTKEDLKEDFKLWKPTNMNAAPKLFERLQTAIRGKGKGVVGGVLESRIGKVMEKPDSRWAGFLQKVGSGATGGNLDFFVSGSAALDPKLFGWMQTLGLEICNGYGMTEALPISVNPPGPDNRTAEGAVGKVLSMWDIRIEEALDVDGNPRYAPTGELIGEILASSPAVMKGYWNQPDKSAEVLVEREGKTYMRTGDLGYIRSFETESGGLEEYLFIVGRQKDEIVLSTGKNVTPGETEDVIKRHADISQALVHGSQKEYLGMETTGSDRPYITALVAPTDEALSRVGKSLGLDTKNLDDLLEQEEVLFHFRRVVSEQVDDLSIYMRPKDIRLIREITEGTRWTLDTKSVTPITPTLKLKRPIVQTYYREKLDEMYKS